MKRLASLHDLLWRGLSRLRKRSGKASGVLLLSAGGLGDTVLFAHLLERFRQLAKPGEEITLLLRSDAAKMGFLFPQDIKIRTVDFGKLRKSLAYRRTIFGELHAAHYRLVVSTDYLRHPLLDETLVAACQAEEALAIEPRPWPKHDRRLKSNRTLYSRLFDSGPPLRDKVLRWNAFADWLTGNEERPPVLGLAAHLLPEPQKLEKKLIMIQPFSAVSLKQVPPEFLSALIDALPSGCDIAILGAPNDLDNNPAYRVLLAKPGVRFDTSLFKDLLPFLRSASLVVSVDTALMHLAVAAGASTLCLASAAYVGEIVPYAPEITPPNVRFLYYPVPCQGCLGDCRLPSENGMYPCLARVSIDDATAAARELLGLK
jgi:ADP-heptose:LPS heptosyltransferase